MPHRDDDDDERPSKRRARDESDKVEVRRLSSQAKPAANVEEDDRPKPTTRHEADVDEEDNRPKIASRRSKGDDDDRPKAKASSAFDDDDEDRPKTKSRRPADDDEDDDDDRPKTKSRRVADDDDDDRPSRRAKRDYDEDDDDDEPRRKKKKRPIKKQLNAVGLIALAIGVIALLLSLTPCLDWIYALVPGIIGIIVGLVGLFVSRQSEGRQGVGLPIAGASLNVVAILIAFGLMMLTKKIGDDFQKEFKDEMEKAEVREKERKEELAKAGPEVKNAQPGSIIQVSAMQFYRAYDDDDERADRLYKNKILEITGTIHEVDFTGEAYIVLLRAGPDEFDTVDCHFMKDATVRQQLAALRPGTQVTIRGKCLGEFSTIEACIVVR
jgi:hypothetical protein